VEIQDADDRPNVEACVARQERGVVASRQQEAVAFAKVLGAAGNPLAEVAAGKIVAVEGKEEVGGRRP
jgi:hypothetical protein